MRRAATDDLVQWKSSNEHKPLMIFGARQVGKTYLVRDFAKKNYKNIFEINFEFDRDAINLFNDNLTVDNLIMQLSAYNPKNTIEPGKTLIFFDEIQRCPNAITALKAFSMDGRYDVIASGSMLGVSLSKVSSYPVGYIQTLQLRPLSFKEFLWANDYSDKQIDEFKSFYSSESLVPQLIHEKLNNMFLQYIVVGGMPAVVSKFVETKNIGFVLKIQKEILEDYSNDIAKYANSGEREKVRECFRSIPDQLAAENKKFQFKAIKSGGNARYFGTSINWLSDSGLVYKINRLKTFDIPLRVYRDPSSFKLYFFDTGLLLAMYDENVQSEILNGNLGVFKGGIFENVIAQVLISNGLNIYYYRRDDRLEIDFVTYLNNNIVPIEVKSGKNTKSISLSNLINKEELNYGIKLSMNNVNCSNEKFKCYPLYMTMFLGN